LLVDKTLPSRAYYTIFVSPRYYIVLITYTSDKIHYRIYTNSNTPFYFNPTTGTKQLTMPAVHINTANVAREIAGLVTRATSSSFGSASKSAHKTARVIGGGIIAAIVIGAVIFIALMLVCAFLVFRRNKKQSARRQQEMEKYYGNNRSSNGADVPAGPAPGQEGFGNPNKGYGYGQGTGYGYAHTAQPGQAGYGAQNTGGVSPMAPAHTADHVTYTK